MHCTITRKKKDIATGVDLKTCEVEVQTVIQNYTKEVQTLPLTCPHHSNDLSKEKQVVTIDTDAIKGVKVVEAKSNEVLYRGRCCSLLLNVDVMDALID